MSIRIEEVRTGQELTWRYSPRGGYGYVFHTPVVVEQVRPQRIQVRAKTRTGAEKLVWVRPENLRPRTGT